MVSPIVVTQSSRDLAVLNLMVAVQIQHRLDVMLNEQGPDAMAVEQVLLSVAYPQLSGVIDSLTPTHVQDWRAFLAFVEQAIAALPVVGAVLDHTADPATAPAIA